MIESPVDIVILDPAFRKEIYEEIGGRDRIVFETENLIGIRPPALPVYWHRNWWRDCEVIPVLSINEGVRALKMRCRLWDFHSAVSHRRAALIQDQLSGLIRRPLPFPNDLNSKRRGVWTLCDRETMVASLQASTPVADGRFIFAENKKGPPNRAYLKLWELFTRIGIRPKAGERCLDLGSSPGGWTWALHNLGSKVISVDKAPIDRRVRKLFGIEFVQESAFGLSPESIGQVDWLFSDVACYPERLFRLVDRWLQSGTVKRMVCTLKFQGKTDFAVARRFEALGGNLVHLYHNKHELTWYWLESS